METNTTPNLIERFNQWLAESVMIKLFSIGFLILILLIPSSWIESLIRERQNRASEVVTEVSDKWSGSQTLSGPVLVIPFTKIEKTKTWRDDKQVEEIIETEHEAYFLPENFKATGKVEPEVLHRGIFDVALYRSKISMEAAFAAPDFTSWSIPDERVHWDKAKLVNSISDLRGIDTDPVIASGETKFVSEPSSNIGISTQQFFSSQPYEGAVQDDAVHRANSSGIVIPLNWKSREDFKSAFNITLSLKGSESLYFVPVGKSTEVNISGLWPSPSFEGKMLPGDRTVTEKDFSATWKILSFNRPFSQKWINNEQALGGSEFGVRLLIPADQYHKSMRTAKYAILIIILAFTALFLVEITSKLKIHPFQYILIGVALIIYYSLLLSLSEHVGYNFAYAIASIATTGLVSVYASTFLRDRKRVFLFGGLMAFFYIFIFVIIQAQDYSLLIGSIGLFLIIGLLMYISRNIKWYKDSVS